MNMNVPLRRKYERKNRYYLLVLGLMALALGIHNILLLAGLEKLTLNDLTDIMLVGFELLFSYLCLLTSFKSYLLVGTEGLEVKDYWGKSRILWPQISYYNTDGYRIILNKPLISVSRFIKPKTEISLSSFLSEEDAKDFEKVLKIYLGDQFLR